MKTEQEIRRHGEDLKILLKMPCTCPPSGHIPACEYGDKITGILAEFVSWILDERDSYGHIENAVVRNADRERQTGHATATGKSLDEIHEYVDSIRTMAFVCSCPRGRHSKKCQLHKYRMQGELTALLWSIGESERFQTHVDIMNKAAHMVKNKKNA